MLVQVNSRLAGVFSFLNLVLFLQVPKITFSLGLVDELYTPLLTAKATGGVGLMGTVLLCETLLSLLPIMSTKDMPYCLLRDYDITLIGSGIMAWERHWSLLGYAQLTGNVLQITRPVVHRVFVPLNHLPADGRRQVIRMLGLLEEIQKIHLQRSVQPS